MQMQSHQNILQSSLFSWDKSSGKSRSCLHQDTLARKYFHTWRVSRFYMAVVKETRVFLGQLERADSRKTRFLWKFHKRSKGQQYPPDGITVMEKQESCEYRWKKMFFTKFSLFFLSKKKMVNPFIMIKIIQKILLLDRGKF